MVVEVLGIDHVQVAVLDLERSEALYGCIHRTGVFVRYRFGVFTR